MAELKEYVVNTGGIDTTVQLSDEDAKRYGEHAKPATKAALAPANKARAAANKGA